jgi:hypothetical protein
MNAGLEKYSVLFLSWSAVIVSLASLRFAVLPRVEKFFYGFCDGDVWSAPKNFWQCVSIVNQRLTQKDD